MRIERQAPKLKRARKKWKKPTGRYSFSKGKWRDTGTGEPAKYGWLTVKRSRAGKRAWSYDDFLEKVAQELAETASAGYVHVIDISEEEGAPAHAIWGCHAHWNDVRDALAKTENHRSLKRIPLMHVKAEFAFDGDFRRIGWRTMSNSWGGDVAVSQAKTTAAEWWVKYKDAIVVTLAFVQRKAPREWIKESRARERRKGKVPRNLRGRGPK